MPDVEAYMLACMSDAAHDAEHIYRVLQYGLRIAKAEGGADLRLLTAACLLHDIGHPEQFADPRVDHAAAGGDKARDWLLANGYTYQFAEAVRHCVQTHRYRSNNPPQTLEAKILFDADKLDVCGAIGVARNLLYGGHIGRPLYSVDERGAPLDGTEADGTSFLHEYNFKTKRLYDRFYTDAAAKIAATRQRAAQDFYAAIMAEIRDCYQGE